MRAVHLLALGAGLAAASPALANESVLKGVANPAEQVLQTVDYANTRYSKLDQINASNVKNLQVAWTFSTGVLRGHEGSPLVVGNIMYVHTPFPNIVYALDLDQGAKIVWKYEPKQGTMDAYGGRITSYSIHYTKLWIQLIDTAGPTYAC